MDAVGVDRRRDVVRRVLALDGVAPPGRRLERTSRSPGVPPSSSDNVPPQKEMARCLAPPEVDTVDVPSHALAVGERIVVRATIGFASPNDRIGLVSEPEGGLVASLRSIERALPPEENEATVSWRALIFDLEAARAGEYVLRWDDPCLDDTWPIAVVESGR